MTPEAWPWSSYRATAGAAPAPGFMTTDWVLGQFGKDRKQAKRAYTRFVRQGMMERSPAPDGGVVLGSQEFLDEVRERIGERERLKEHPRAQRLVARPSLDALLSEAVLSNREA